MTVGHIAAKQKKRPGRRTPVQKERARPAPPKHKRSPREPHISYEPNENPNIARREAASSLAPLRGRQDVAVVLVLRVAVPLCCLADLKCHSCSDIFKQRIPVQHGARDAALVAQTAGTNREARRYVGDAHPRFQAESDDQCAGLIGQQQVPLVLNLKVRSSERYNVTCVNLRFKSSMRNWAFANSSIISFQCSQYLALRRTPAEVPRRSMCRPAYDHDASFQSAALRLLRSVPRAQMQRLVASMWVSGSLVM